jgi:hypothetical protein
MSMQQTSNHMREPLVSDPDEITLATWLAEGRRAPPQAAVRLISEMATALGDAHRHGVRHGALSTADVVLSGWSSSSLGTPVLRGFAPSTAAGPRREDIARDVAGLAGLAEALLLPAPAPARGRRSIVPPRERAAAAVIGAGLDLREGVFVFESPIDFAAALQAAVAADAGAPSAPDPALLAMQARRRRRRVIKLVTGTAVAFLALLVVSNATATHRSPAPSRATSTQTLQP